MNKPNFKVESQNTKFQYLLDKYELFIFDVQGVLLTNKGALPGTVAALEKILESGKDFRICTNDASRDPDVLLNYFLEHKFPVTSDKIVSSGMLLKDFFIKNNLAGAKTITLGPKESLGYLEGSGAKVIDFNHEAKPEVVVILNQDYSQPLDVSISILLSTIMNQLKKGITPSLVVPNCDLDYPSAPGKLNIAPGGIATIIEASIKNYLGNDSLKFTRLGKPNSPIFLKALGYYDPKKAIFFGDQFNTDILGANSVGINSVLVLTGINVKSQISLVNNDRKPKYILESF